MTKANKQLCLATYNIWNSDEGMPFRCECILHEIQKIHPDIGDVITIDFPDSKSRQQYEITDCYDKRLTTDGINPLLHKYVWKCKAKRRIDAGENIPEKNEDNERMEGKKIGKESVISSLNSFISKGGEGYSKEETERILEESKKAVFNKIQVRMHNK